MTISWVSGDLPGTPSNAMGAHGKPDERVKWFRTGYDSGSADECLTLTPHISRDVWMNHRQAACARH